LVQLEEIRRKLNQALEIIREAIDESLEIMAGGQEGTKEVTALWEEFLREFLTCIKQRSRETGRNLFAAVSFKKIWPR